MIKKSLFILAVAALFTASAVATDYYWNAASGNWSNTSNWNPTTAHVANDIIWIDNGGTVTVDTDTVGYQKVWVDDGTINLGTGVTLDTGQFFNLGRGDGNVGTLNMTGGTVDTGSVTLGREESGLAGDGYINMSGGTFDATAIELGSASGSKAEFDLSGGTVNVSGALVVGVNSTMGDVVFDQSGGTVNVTGYVEISQYDSNPFGPVNGKGIYEISGGTLNAASDLYVGADDLAPGVLKITGGEVVVGGDLLIQGVDSYIDDAGSSIGNAGTLEVWGDFINGSTAKEDFDMTHTTLIMADGGAGWINDTVGWEVTTLDMGDVVDMGDDLDGLIWNYAIGDLIFKGTDTGSVWYKLESDIYCYGLVIEEGATVNLNGYTIYYMPENAASYGGSRPTTHALDGYWGNGSLVELTAPAIPEPGTIVLIGTGVLGLAAVLRKKYC